MSELELFELAGQEDTCLYSHHCLKVRLALAHKGLAFRPRPWRLSEKSRIAPLTKVPVLSHNGKTVGESYDIIKYLDREFPDIPALLPEDPYLAFMHTWTATGEPVTLIFKIVVKEMLEHMPPEDKQYFLDTMQERLADFGAHSGTTLDEFTAGQEDHITALGEALEPAREVLHRHKWLAGASPGYPDICLFALFTWARNVSQAKLLQPSDPLHEWRARCQQHYHWAIL